MSIRDVLRRFKGRKSQTPDHMKKLIEAFNAVSSPQSSETTAILPNYCDFRAHAHGYLGNCGRDCRDEVRNLHMQGLIDYREKHTPDDQRSAWGD